MKVPKQLAGVPGSRKMTTAQRSRKKQNVRAFFTAFLISFASLPASDAAVFNVPRADVPALVAAINAANANGADDTINLKGGVYTLTNVDNEGTNAGPNGLPRIDTTIAINGRGSVIRATGGFRIFYVAAEGRLVLNGVTVRDGNTDYGGGGVQSEGHLVIVNSTFHGNRGGEGGALLNDGTAVIWQSTFSANSAGPDDSGGAIRNHGSMSIVNSTFSGNSAFDNGGAIRSDGPVLISNSTFVDNTAGFGGGAIQGSNSGETSIIKNLIVASNTPQNCEGVSVVQGDNFDTDGTCGGLFVTPEQLKLGPLAKYRGATRSHALLRGSAAIDAVQDCTSADGLPVTVDQRGIERPQGKVCDAGAFETGKHPFPPGVVP
jgi:predicted outer membrane repeat protein